MRRAGNHGNDGRPGIVRRKGCSVMTASKPARQSQTNDRELQLAPMFCGNCQPGDDCISLFFPDRGNELIKRAPLNGTGVIEDCAKLTGHVDMKPSVASFRIPKIEGRKILGRDKPDRRQLLDIGFFVAAVWIPEVGHPDVAARLCRLGSAFTHPQHELSRKQHQRNHQQYRMTILRQTPSVSDRFPPRANRLGVQFLVH